MPNSTANMDGPVPVFGISPNMVLLALLSWLTVLLDLPSLIWYIKHQNLPAASLIFWVLLSNILNVVNSMIWPDDNFAVWFNGKIFCDIQVKLELAMNVASVGSTVCIMKTLSEALDPTASITVSIAKRQRKTIFDCLLCFGLPLYMMAVHYIVQPSRYYIFGISGCTASIDNSWPMVPLLLIWPVIFGLLAAFYAVKVILRVRKYRTQIGSVLRSSSALTAACFRRLFAMAFTIIAMMLPVLVYVLYANTTAEPLQPYSWDRVHAGFFDIIYIPAYGTVLFDRWIRVASGFIVFVCFGFTQDAIKMYKQWARAAGLSSAFTTLASESAASHASTTSFGSRTKDFLTKKFCRGTSSSTASQTSSLTAVQSFARGQVSCLYDMNNKSLARIRAIFRRKMAQSDAEKAIAPLSGIRVEQTISQHISFVNNDPVLIADPFGPCQISWAEAVKNESLAKMKALPHRRVIPLDGKKGLAKLSGLHIKQTTPQHSNSVHDNPVLTADPCAPRKVSLYDENNKSLARIRAIYHRRAALSDAEKALTQLHNHPFYTADPCAFLE